MPPDPLPSWPLCILLLQAPASTFGDLLSSGRTTGFLLARLTEDVHSQDDGTDPECTLCGGFWPAVVLLAVTALATCLGLCCWRALSAKVVEAKVPDSARTKISYVKMHIEKLTALDVGGHTEAFCRCVMTSPEQKQRQVFQTEPSRDLVWSCNCEFGPLSAESRFEIEVWDVDACIFDAPVVQFAITGQQLAPVGWEGELHGKGFGRDTLARLHVRMQVMLPRPPTQKRMLFLGTEGVGKSTLMRSVMSAYCEAKELITPTHRGALSNVGDPELKKGHICTGVEQVRGWTFIDVPSLRNPSEATAALIDLSLVPGTYKVVFVLSAVSGRLHEDDLQLLDLVQSTAQNQAECGFILNRVPQRLLEESSHLVAKHFLLEGRRVGEHVVIIPEVNVNALRGPEGKSSFEMPISGLTFLHDLPDNLIPDAGAAQGSKCRLCDFLEKRSTLPPPSRAVSQKALPSRASSRATLSRAAARLDDMTAGSPRARATLPVKSRGTLSSTRLDDLTVGPSSISLTALQGA